MTDSRVSELRIALFVLLAVTAVTIVAFVPSTINMIASFVGLVAGLALGILSGGRSA